MVFMVRVKFRARILCDDKFMEYVLTHPKKITIMKNLMRIKSVSEDYKGEHNVIADFDFKRIKHLTKHEYTLRASVKEKTVESFCENGMDELTKRIFYAIDLSTKTPFYTYIFTTDERKKKYLENYHLLNMKNIKIKNGEDAIEIIEDFFREFEMKRELNRQ